RPAEEPRLFGAVHHPRLAFDGAALPPHRHHAEGGAGRGRRRSPGVDRAETRVHAQAMVGDPDAAGQARGGCGVNAVAPLTIVETGAEPVIRLDAIRRDFGPVQALRGVSLGLRPGKALALVGESGCGKTTCARIIARMDWPTAGEMFFRDGRVTEAGSPQEERAFRRAVDRKSTRLNSSH